MEATTPFAFPGPRRNPARPHAPLPALLVAVTALLAACDADRRDAPDFMVRDSAGIRVAESAVPAWPVGGGWVVSSRPTVRIGTTEGVAAQQLAQVGDAVRLPDGRILVANGGTHEVGVYDADGQHLRTIGGQGSGPGEFNTPRRVWLLPGDSLVVLDFVRISVFDSAGAFVRSRSNTGWSPHDMFADGAFLWKVIPPGEDLFEPGFSRPRVALVRTEMDGTGGDTLAYLSGDELYRIQTGAAVASYPAPFGRIRHVAARDNLVYTGDGATFAVTVLDETGAVRGIMRRAHEREPVGAAHIDALEGGYLERVRTDNQRRTRMRLFQEWTYPDHLPAYDELVVDRRGNVWVHHFAVTGQPSPWTVFDANGRWLGMVELPAGLAVEEIGGDYVLGVRTNELGVESVEVYTLMDAHVPQESAR